MAFVVMEDNSTHTLTPEQGRAIWFVLNNEQEPENEQQEQYCLRVKHLYLNRDNAPQSYLDKHPVREEPTKKHYQPNGLVQWINK